MELKYNITELDKSSLLQNSIKYKYRLYIVDNSKNILDLLEGEKIQNVGEYNIDSQSDVRRTSSFTIQLDARFKNKSIEKKLFSWIGFNFNLQIGIFNLRQEDYIWYECGYYAITSANTSYSSIGNQLSVSLSDWIVKLDGTKNGVIGGSPTIIIPVEDDNGNKTIIKQALIAFLKLSTDVTDYIIDDIGEFYGLPENNPDWEQYRKNRPDWNVLPHDLEFDGSATILDIVRSFCQLYPNYQYYFDTYGNICVSMIPSCENSIIVLDNNYLQKILVADDTESVDYDITAIKNVTEVFGQTYEVDWMSESCSTSSNIYTINLDNYSAYKSNEYVAFMPNTNNISNMKLRINSLEVIPIYLEESTTYIDANIMDANEVYVIKIKKVSGRFVAYYLGQYQPHALCVLTNNTCDPIYTKQYFAEKYNCDVKNVVFRVEDSPFAIQKIGEVLDYKAGGDFENIESDSVAIENAIYYNRQSTSFNDVITITTKMIPFLDVNEKVSYCKKQEQKTLEYIIKSISHNLESMTTTITMYRFYPLYYD